MARARNARVGQVHIGTAIEDSNVDHDGVIPIEAAAAVALMNSPIVKPWNSFLREKQ